MKRRVPVLMDDELVEKLDRWRGRERDVPNRSEAIRRLVEKALGESWKSESGKNES